MNTNALPVVGTTEQIPVPRSETAAVLNMIERAARDPSVDMDKLERLMAMHERLQVSRAKQAYDAAMAEMQPKLPAIDRRGKIEIREKDKSTNERTGKIQQSTPYALWEDINEAIRPVLAEHGFSLTFRAGRTPEGLVTVTGILAHREGHREDDTVVLQHDSTGSKNAVQAVGSSNSYGKRYTAINLLNITTRGQDDDGKAAGQEHITAEQVERIKKLTADFDSETMIGLLKYVESDSIEGIAPANYDKAVYAIGIKKGQKK